MAVSNFVESVEFIEYTLAGTALSGTATLSGSQDLSNCVPFMTSHGGSDYQDSHMLDIYFESSATVVFKRATQRSNALTIRCYIVEFNSEEVRVQQGSFDLNSQNTDTITLGTTLSGTDRAAMTHFWWSSSSSQGFSYHFVRGRVVDTATVDFYRNNTSASCQGHWYLFEDLGNNFRVTHHSNSYSSSGQTTVIKTDRSGIDPLRSFLIGSYASASSSTYTSRGTTRLFFYSDGTIRSDKGDSSYYTVYWAMQIVEFLDKTKVYTPFDNHLLNNMTDSESSKTLSRGNDATISPLVFNPNTSIVVHGGPQGLVRCNSTSTAAINQIFVSAKLSGNDSLYLERSGSGNYVYPSTLTVVDWAGIDIDIGTNNDPIPEGDGPGESFVKSVETFRLTVEQNFSYKVLSKGQNWRNCVIFASHHGTSGDYMTRHIFNVYLLEPGIVCAFRWSTSGQGIVEISVVEFWPEQVKVQHKNVTLYGQSTTTTDIEEVADINKCFITSKTFTSANVTRHSDSMVRVRFVDTDTVEYYRYSSSYEVDTSIFVVEDLKDNFVTRHFQGSSSAGWNDIYDDEHVSGYNNTFLICSYASANGGGYPSRGAIRSFLAMEDWLRVNKSDSSYYGLYWSLTTVKFTGDKVRTQSVNISLPAVASGTANYLEEFVGHEDVLTCYNVVQSSTVRCDTSSTGGVSESFASIRILDRTNRLVEATKTGASYNSYGSFILIDWIGHHYQNADSVRKHVPTRSLVNSVERLEYYGGKTFVSFPLSKGQNIKQCVPFITLSNNASDQYITRLYKRVYRFEDPDYFTVLFPAAASGDRYISLYVVEFNSNVKIQHGSALSTGTTATVSIDEVDLDRAFLVFYGCSDDWSGAHSHQSICGHFTSSTEIEFVRVGSSQAMFVSWYVVECTEEDDYWRVQHAYKTGLGGSSSVYVQLPHKPHVGRTMFLSSWTTNNTSGYPSRSMYRVYHRQDHQIQFNKNDASYYNMNNANVEAIEFSKDVYAKDFKSYGLFVLFGGGTSAVDSSVYADKPIDLSRAIVISGNLGNEGRVDTTNNSAWDQGFHHYEFKDGNTITSTRTGGSSYVSYSFPYIYQFPMYNKYYVEGYVKEKGIPVQRDVCMYRSSTGELTDSTTSISGTGYFWLETPYGEQHYVVCLDDEAKPDYNHLIYGKVMPTVISGSYPYNEGLVTTSGLDEGIPLIFQEDYS